MQTFVKKNVFRTVRWGQTEHWLVYNNKKKRVDISLNMAFEKPTITVIGHIGPLTNDEIAALPDDALAEYLEKNGYFEAKRRAIEMAK